MMSRFPKQHPKELKRLFTIAVWYEDTCYIALIFNTLHFPQKRGDPDIKVGSAKETPLTPNLMGAILNVA